MVDDATKIYTLNPTAKATVLTKANGAGAAFFIGVGNTLYIGDGAEQVAWTGVGTVRNWGIAALQAGAPGNAYAGTGGGRCGGWAARGRTQRTTGGARRGLCDRSV